AGNDLLAVVVRVDRVGDGARRIVEGLAARQAGALVAGLAADALVAGPAEVLDGVRREHVVEAVDLLPRVPPDVADPELARAGPQRHAEWVAKAVGDDALGAGNAAVGERIVRHRGARRRIDAQDGAVEADRLTDAAQALRPQRAAFRRRRRLRATDPARRIAARVHERIPGLAVVDEREARAVATAHVEGAVGAEEERPDRVAGKLLAPVLQEHVLAARHHHVAGRLQAREP